MSTVALTVLSALLAVVGSASFTGRAGVDAVERLVLAGVFTWVVAHGRRSTSFVAAVLLLPFVRDRALLLLVVALVAGLLNLRGPRRRKDLGAVTAGAFVNAILHPELVGPRSWMVPGLVLLVVVVFVAAVRQMRRRHRRILRIGFSIVAATIPLLVLATAVGVWRAAEPVRSGARGAEQALRAVRDGDTTRAGRQLDEAHRDLEDGAGFLSTLAAPGRLLPGISQQLAAVEITVDEARTLTGLADDLLSTDYADLRYEGRFDLDLVDDLLPGTERIDGALRHTDDRLDDLRRQPLLPPLRSQIEDFHTTVREAHADTERARRILPHLRGLLGGDGERTYLLVFITPAELRGAGGFIGSWAELHLLDGRATLTESGRIRDLIDYGTDTGRVLGGPADYRRRYGRHHVENLVQDAPMSPDWPSNAEALASIHPQAGGSEVDGVIAVTPVGLASLLEFTGPVRVDGLDEPLDAHNAVDLLLRDQYLLLGERAAREEVLADASEAIFDALVDTTLPAPRTIGDVLGPVVRGRHIQVWTTDPGERELLGNLGADGALEIPTGALGWRIAQQNVGNNKIDAYLHRDVALDITLDAISGEWTGTMTIGLLNDPPSLDLPDVVVGNQRGRPRGTALSTLAVHGPLEVDAASLDGRPVDLGPGSELGLPAWNSPLVETAAGERGELVLDVGGRIDPSHGFRLRLLPQPMANPDTIRIDVRLTGGRFGDVTGSPIGPTVTVTPDALALEGTLPEVVDITADLG